MLREYLKSLADKFREVLGYDEGDPINAQDFINKIPETFELGKSLGYEEGAVDGYGSGFIEGQTKGYSEGEKEGFGAGHTQGYEEGQSKGYEDGKQAEYDKFWDNFQDNGNRYLYNYAFRGYGWNSNNFYPKYDLKPQNDASYMFYNFAYGDTFSLKERLEECGVIFDTSKVKRFQNMFGYGGAFLELPTIDFTGIDTSVSNAYQNNVFAYCRQLRTIEKVIVNENTTFTGWFIQNQELANIVFEGTIANNISFAESPLLTHESLMSIINHLKDFSGTGTTHTLTIGTTNQVKLTDAEKALVTEKGWTLA